ncbi:MAG: hypothetical protein ACAI25_12255 [Planctomycetota bacterium]
MATPREIALVHATPTRARAVHAVREGDGFRIAATTETTGETAPRAAAAALAQLDPQGRLPVHAITRDVTASCLELPPTADALPEARLRELVRWEIEPFLPGEGEAKCAWAERRTSVDGKSRRLASGVRGPVLESWRAALGDRELVALYPAWVCSTPFVEGDEPAFLVEVDEDAIGVLRLQGVAVESVRVRDRIAGDDPAAQLADLVGPAPATVWLGGANAASAREPLERQGFAVRPLPADAALHGAIRHAFGLDGADRVGAVAACDPTPPLHRQPWVHAAAAGLLLLLGVTAWTISLGRSVAACDVRITELQAIIARRPANAPAVVEAKPAVQTEVDKLEKDAKAVAAARARIEEDVIHHGAVTLALLDALAAETNEEVSVDSCRETKPAQWRVDGFGLSDEAIQRFHLALGKSLARAGLEAALQGVRADRGRLGLNGWRFEVLVARRGGKP